MYTISRSDFLNKHKHVLNRIIPFVGHDNVMKVLDMYQQPHRYYHNLWHLDDLFTTYSLITFDDKMPDTIDSAFLLAILYHDAVYNPRNTGGKNEDESLNLFKSHIDSRFGKGKVDEGLVYSLIEATKGHNEYEKLGKYEKLFIELDLRNLAHGSLAEVIEAERRVFKEYQFVDYSIYRDERMKILNYLSAVCYRINSLSNVGQLIKLIEQRVIKVAVYPGSFFPLHRGHYDIIKKAEKIFDKVIIAVGVNPDKETNNSKKAYVKYLMKEVLPFHQVETFDGLLTDYIEDKSSEHCQVSIVKGLGRPGDYEYEKTQIRYIREFDTDVSVVLLPSDLSFEHVSSSMLKSVAGIKNARLLSEKYEIGKWPDAEGGKS